MCRRIVGESFSVFRYLYAPASEQERLRPLFELLVVGGDLQGRAAGRRPARRHARPAVVRVPGRGRQLRRHQEAPPAGHHRPRPGHPAADHLARRGPAPAPLRPPRLHRAERPSGQAAAVRGQADPASLELASKLVGDEAVTQTSETTGGDGRASLTESTAYRRLLPPEALRQLKPRRALLVYGHLPPVRIRLRPWFRSRRLVTLAMAVDAAVPHPAMQSTTSPRSSRCVRPTRRGGGRLMGTFLDDLDDHEGYARPAPPQRPAGRRRVDLRHPRVHRLCGRLRLRLAGHRSSTRRPRRARQAAVDQWRSEHAEPGAGPPGHPPPRRTGPGVGAGWPARPTGSRTPPPWSASAAPCDRARGSSMTSSAIWSGRRPQREAGGER